MKIQPKRNHVRSDNISEIRCMSCAENYVMVRRNGCMPFVLTIKEWYMLDISKTTSGEELKQQPHVHDYKHRNRGHGDTYFCDCGDSY